MFVGIFSIHERANKLKFAILCSGTTIYDEGKSERSNDVGLRVFVLIMKVINNFYY